MAEGRFVDRKTGEVGGNLWCNAVHCAFCGRVKAERDVHALRASAPERAITLTQVGDDWSTIRERVKHLRKVCTRSGFDFEWAWCIECGHVSYPVYRHTHHIHALAHGNVPDTPTLSGFAERVGFGQVVENESVRNVDAASRYLTKDARKLPAVDRPHHLSMNGGASIHASKNFWRADGITFTSRHDLIRTLLSASVPCGVGNAPAQ